MTLNRAVFAPMPSASVMTADDREAGRTPKRPLGIPKVLQEIVGPPQRARVTAALLRLLDAAERDARAPLRLGSAHAALQVGLRLHRDVKRQLVVEIVLGAPRPDEGADAGADAQRSNGATPWLKPPSVEGHA